MNRTQRRAMANVKSKTMEEHFKNTAKILDDIDRRLCKLEQGLESLEGFLEEELCKRDKIKTSIPGMEPGESSPGEATNPTEAGNPTEDLIKTGDEND